MSTNAGKPQLFIGLMSGTSADGVDAALVEVENESINLIDFSETAIPKSLKQSLIELNQKQNIELNQLCYLEKAVADLFIQAVQSLLTKNHLNASDITAIGSHGQTIFHAPDIPMTLQIGHPAFIAKQTGITTVADFRVDDMALNGQGAPFAPAFHQKLFEQNLDSFAVNIGGIANISFVPNPTSNKKILGWDTGPGNGIMDELCQTVFNCPYDKNGAIAATGTINNTLLTLLKEHHYFEQPAPKSTGRETFNLDWVYTLINQHNIDITPTDLLTTLCELTAQTISDQINLFHSPSAPINIVGGGAYNGYLISRIQAQLNTHEVKASSADNMNPNAIEAMMCAWLAQQRVNNQPVSLASITGAERDAVLGGIWHP